MTGWREWTVQEQQAEIDKQKQQQQQEAGVETRTTRLGERLFYQVWSERDIQDAHKMMGAPYTVAGAPLTADQIGDVIASLDRGDDADAGINWRVIQAHIEECGHYLWGGPR